VKNNKMVLLTRRELLKIGGAGLAALGACAVPLIGCGSSSGDGGDITGDTAIDDRYFYFAALADTHIIDEFYEGPEGSPLDTESIFLTTDRLTAARTAINNLPLPIDLVTIAGDFIHNYPSADYSFYEQNITRIDNAKQLIDGFNMPVHVGLGNHDYDLPHIPREFTHELFAEKLGIEPYYSVDHKGWKFIHVNNFLGVTFEAGNTFNKEAGTLGETQLNWLEAELEQNMPSFVFVHFPPILMQSDEFPGYDFFTVLAAHSDKVKLVISGHLHRWLDFIDIYTPPQIVISSTRYDEDAYLVIKVDREEETIELMNLNCVAWNGYETEPYTG
jgi:3',5'-cyclic-AMP phosphodiesterase